MENKQIVNDVDVSGCKHYKNRNCIADYCLTDMSFSKAKCELNPNCYYKQLQREKQNSQEARDIAIKEFNRAEELKTLLKRKEQECEELRRSITKIFTCLIKANNRSKIIDTLWVDRITTLWDYIALTLGIEGDQTQIEEQILQKIS